jgi:hypothetical protein
MYLHYLFIIYDSFFIVLYHFPNVLLIAVALSIAVEGCTYFI